MEKLIRDERDRSGSCSLFIISEIKQLHVQKLNKTPEKEFKRLTKDLSRIYHYYLHGKDGQVAGRDEYETSGDEEASGSEHSSEDDSSSAGQGGSASKALPPATHKRKCGKGKGGGLPSNKKPKGGERVSAGRGGLGSGGRRGSAEPAFRELEICVHRCNKDGKVRLHYFPAILDKETRPLDEIEAKEKIDGPFLSIYWQGRWIPYSNIKSLPKALFGTNAETIKLLNRTRGTIFFPQEMKPSNTKLVLNTYNPFPTEKSTDW
ncbi:hypothetical protein T484DRAFT_1776462 [Baffinella frigidus]|nr:hypothetical protein T484DRAFT_1776462 [Cryptophyta sp. CCMP2293]